VNDVLAAIFVNDVLAAIIYQLPLITTKDVKITLKVSTMAALQLVRKFEKAGILKEITGKKRYQQFIFKEYMDIGSYPMSMGKI
jgi:DNA-binding Lrp family transcriptional regulator